MCRLNQLEEFHKSKDREIERLKVRCVLFYELNELSIYVYLPSPHKLVFGWRKQVPAQKYVKTLIYPIKIYGYQQQAYLH